MIIRDNLRKEGGRQLMSIEVNKIKAIIDERQAISPNNEVAVEKKQDELFEALGDNEQEIRKFLNICTVDELKYISEVFEDIYRKFPNDDMWDFLEILERKVS